jgi:hypothetical protein
MNIIYNNNNNNNNIKILKLEINELFVIMLSKRRTSIVFYKEDYDKYLKDKSLNDKEKCIK